MSDDLLSCDKKGEMFCRFSKLRIVLYGIGIKTKALIESRRYNICGILDNNIEDGFVGNVRIIGLDEVDRIADCIVIATEMKNAIIIYGRISNNSSIPIFSYYGERLSDEIIQRELQKEKCFIKNNTLSLERCYEEISSHDVISFDIFDTLIGREVSYPLDVYDIIEHICKNKGWYNGFKESRCSVDIYSEQTHSNHTLDELYINLNKHYGLSEQFINDVKRTEVDLDKFLTYRIDRNNKLLEYALKTGKIVILTSDMYYTSEMMKDILIKNSIKGYDDVYISCELKLSKQESDIYEWLSDKYSGKQILHFGDNYYGDFINSKEKGLDAVYLINSSDCIIYSDLYLIKSFEKNLLDSIVVGLFQKHFISNCSMFDFYYDNKFYKKEKNRQEWLKFISIMLGENKDTENDIFDEYLEIKTYLGNDFDYEVSALLLETIKDCLLVNE